MRKEIISHTPIISLGFLVIAAVAIWLLISQGSVSEAADPNNAFTGDVGYGSEYAGFSHINSSSVDGYALLQHNSGMYTLMNKKSGGGWLGFRVDNNDKMIINDSGNVGIGTVDPSLGGRVGSKFTILSDVTGLVIGRSNGIPSFALNPNPDQSWTAYDYVSNRWNPGITQKGGKVGIGTTAPETKLEVAGNLTVGNEGDNSEINFKAANGKTADIGVQDDSDQGFYIRTGGEYRMSVNQNGEICMGFGC